MARRKRRLLAALMIVGAGTAFQTGLVPSGCPQFGAQLGAFMFDWCAVLNCSSGTFFNFCSPAPLLLDCPNIEAP